MRPQAGLFADHARDLVNQLSGEYDEEEAEALARLEAWRKDPALWANERLEIPLHTLKWSLNEAYRHHAWDGTPDPIYASGLALGRQEDVTMESGTGTGKTFWAAVLCLWFLDVYPEDALVISTAPRQKQLTLNMWKEIGKLWGKFEKLHPEARLTKLRIRMRPGREDWAAYGVVAGVGADEESATRMQGFHGRNMLFIFEETPGIHSAIMTAVENTCTAPNNLRIGLGNPDHRQDALHRMSEEPDVHAIRVSALDHPNIVADDPHLIPGAVSRKSISKRERKFGKDSRIYQSRVRGISPEEASDALIPWSWLVACVDNDTIPELDTGPALGVDVAASENGDRGAIAEGTGNRLERVRTWRCPDPNGFARERVAPMMDIRGILPVRVGVDNVGVGAGAYNELRRLGKPVQGLGGAESPKYVSGQAEEFNNLRSQMWWQFREDARNGRIHLPDDEELFEDLTALSWTEKNGKIVVQSKDKVRATLKRSPDKGDAAVYWNWVRQHRAGSSKGGTLVTL